MGVLDKAGRGRIGVPYIQSLVGLLVAKRKAERWAWSSTVKRTGM